MTERQITLRIVSAALPTGAHGMCIQSAGTDALTVVINDTDTDDQQAFSFLHEMLHIWHDDFSRTGVDVGRLERERNRELSRLLKLSN